MPRPAERITVQFTTENAAFTDEPATEIARILRQLADLVASGMAADHNTLRDINGNTVGACTIHSIGEA